ncbi:MAG TPA: DUF1360 domain-containing protein [Methylomirabilota bacterium]|jgi:hypothetical protein
MTLDGAVLFRFLIAALATWRVAFLLARERGPWRLFARWRQSARGVVGELLRCVKCVGLWVAIPFAFFVRGADWPELVVTWLALAGVTALIDEWTRQPFEWQETKEDGQGTDGGDVAQKADRQGLR